MSNSTPKKRCSKCGRDLPATPHYFFKNHERKDGFGNPCKECKGFSFFTRYPTLPDGYKKCGRGDRCIHIEGPVLPATTDLFFANRNRSDGLTSVCKVCQQNDYELNKKAIKERRKIYRNKNRERLLRKNRKFYQENREVLVQKKRVYRKNNPEKTRAACRSYYRNHRAEDLERTRRWRKDNPQRVKLHSKTANHRRRARMRNAKGSFTTNDVIRLLKLQKGRCYWCDENCKKEYEIDHVIPLARGGSNYASNIVIACKSCNRSKQDKLPHEWGDKMF